MTDESDNEILMLLLQRAIQSTCFTARACRDPPTAQWLAAFGGEASFERMHAIGCLQTPWREYLLAQLEAPPTEIMVESSLKKHRGISADNPYLKPTTMTYAYELRPTELAERVMLASRQIAREWAEDDLLRMAAENEQIWRERRATVTLDEEELRTTIPAFANEQDGSGSGDGSPYRGGNYDLLLVAVTRRAARCALREYAAQPSKRDEHAVLRDHMRALPADGEELPYNAADAWLTALLDKPIVLRLVAADAADGADGGDGGGGGGGASLVDPRAIVERILDYRLAVAREWTETMLAVPEMYLSIKREHLMSRAGASLTGEPKVESATEPNVEPEQSGGEE